MSRRLGTAFIDVEPQTLGFGPALRAKLKAALRGVNAEVPVTADTLKLDAAIAAARAKIATLKAATSGLKLDADNKALVAKIAGLQKQSATLANSMQNMEADVDIRAAATKILALAAQIRVLQSDAEKVKLSADTGALQAKLAAAQAEVDGLVKKRDIAIGADTGAATSKLVALKALMASLFTTGGGAGGGKNAGIAGLTYGFYGFGRILTASVGGLKLWHAALSLALETLISVGSAVGVLALGLAAAAPAAKDIVTQLRAIDTVNEVLGGQIPSLTSKFDALAQSLAPQVIEAFGGALGAVSKNSGVFAAAARQSVTLLDDWVARIDIWAKSQNNMAGLLHAGMGFLQQFGDAVGHLLSAFDNLLKAAPGTAHFLLDMIVGFTALLSWVSKLPRPVLEVALAWHSAYIYGRLFTGIMSLMPGVIGKVGRALVALGGPTLAVLAAIGVIAFVMARNWNTASKAVVASIANIDTALGSMSAGQAFFAIPAAIGELNRQLHQVSSSGDIAAIQKNWTGLNDIWTRADDKVRVIGADLKGIVTGSLVHELMSLGNVFKDAFTSNAGQREAAVQQQKDLAALNDEINKLLGSQRNLDHETGVLIGKGYTFSQSLALMSLAGVQVNDNFDLMQQKVQNLIGGFEAMSVRGGILTNSVNALTFASGLQSSKVNDLNSAWDTFIATVTGSESSFATVETDISGIFSAAASAGSHLTDSNGRVSNSFGPLVAAADGAKGSFTGLNKTSLGLQETFNQSVTAANAMLDALTTQAAAAGLGKHGTDLLTQATKDLVVQMLPAASGSKILTAELFALAQRGGFQGADSFKALSGWVGKTRDPMKSLQGVVQTFTVAAAGLTTDVKNLSVALGTTLNQAMAQAVFLASGGQKAFTDFAKAVLTSRGNVDKMRPSAATLSTQLIHMTGSVTDAKKEFEAFAVGALKLTQKQADELWKSVQGGAPVVAKATGVIVASFNRQKGAADVARLGVDLLTASIKLNSAGSSATQTARKNLIADMVRAGVNATTATRDVNSYTNAVAHNAANSDAVRAARSRLNADLVSAALNSRNGQRDLNLFTSAVANQGTRSDAFRSARAALIADLERTGVNATTAKRLVDNLQQSVNAMHGKTVNVGVHASGSGSITATESIPGGVAMKQNGHLVFFASGGRVSGAGTGDTVPAMLTPGEVVVPKGMVQAGAVNHLRGKLPGFASGGLVGGGLVDFTANQEGGFGSSSATGFAQDMLAAFRKAVAAAAAAAAAKAAKAAAGAGSPVAYSHNAGVTQWEPDVLRVLAMLGLPAADLPTVMSQIQTECVTIDTLILTKRGWLDYTEVQPGDETIGYNPETDRSEWTPIERVVHYPQRETWRFGNKYWSVKCTPNHRWLTEHVVRRPAEPQQQFTACPECSVTGSKRGPFKSQRAVRIHRAREHAVAGDWGHGAATAEQVTGARLLPLQDIHQQDRVVLAREADTGTSLDVTLGEAALLGWIAGDGWVSEHSDHWRDRKPEPERKPPDAGAPFGYRRDGQPRKNRSGRPLATGPVHTTQPLTIGISQSKPEHFPAIDRACGADPNHVRYPERPGRKPHHKPAVAWRLSTAYSRDLLKRAGNPKTDAVRQVLQMSSAQREAWLDAMIAAEGSRGPTKTVIYQNDGPVADAIELAVYLSGHRPARTKAHSGWGISITAARVGGPSRNSFREPAGSEDVWCVTTGLGTWTARQEGHVFLTGNSGGNPNAINLTDSNARAGTPSKGLLQVIAGTFAAYRNRSLSANIYDPLANIYAGLNYAIHRYGNPGWLSVLGHGHGYAAGGLVTEQAAERGAYGKLATATKSALAHPSAWLKTHKTSVAGELGTLAGRQSAEQAAYAQLSGKGLTKANLSKFDTRAREELTTDRDKFLSTAEPSLTRQLAATLNALLTSHVPLPVTKPPAPHPGGTGGHPGGTGGHPGGTGGHPGGTGGGTLTGRPTAARQAAEASAYRELSSTTRAALTHPDAWLKAHKTSVTGELGTLAKRQAGEQAAYAALAGKGLTKSNLSKLSTRVREELTTDRDKFISTAEPALTGRLAAALNALTAGSAPHPGGSGGSGGHPGGSGGSGGHPGGHPGGSGGSGDHRLASGLTLSQYQADLQEVHGLPRGDIRSNPHLRHIWHLLHLQHLADVRGPGQVMDAGGWLPTGPSMVWNQTGRPEHLIPTGNGSPNITIKLETASSGSEFDRFMMEWMRRHTRIRGGGDVQRAFGRDTC